MRSRRKNLWLAVALFGLGCDPVPPQTGVTPPLVSTSGETANNPTSSASGVASAPPIAEVMPPKLAIGGEGVVSGKLGMVAAVEANAVKAGADVLSRGGNAIDAAVATAFALAVTHPSAGNIGGGGFMLVHLATGETFAIDFRETAPSGATTKKVLDEIAAGAGGYASVAVPGTVAGLALVRDKWGTKPLADLIAPAIALAKKGHKLGPRAALALSWQWPKLKGDKTARAIFGKGDDPLKAGERLVQKDLARTLELIASKGPAAFYEGEIAKDIVAAMKSNRGDITAEDLSSYRPEIRSPLAVKYRGLTVETMPPPSMGGIAIAEMLVNLDAAKAYEAGDILGTHLFVEAAKRAYRDRRTVGADPAFNKEVVTPEALAKLLDVSRTSPPLSRERATPASAIAPPKDKAHESPETTHFSVVDEAGNAVSCTVTLSASFGARIVIPKTGIVMSNALGGFSASGVNEVKPGKRMASSMSPTIVSHGGRVRLVIGSPGGDTIPNTIVSVLRHIVDDGMTLDQAVRAPRVHHQLEPDEIRIEAKSPIPEATRKGLEALGHKVVPNPMVLGDVKVILVDPDTRTAYGYADQREGGVVLSATAKDP